MARCERGGQRTAMTRYDAKEIKEKEVLQDEEVVKEQV